MLLVTEENILVNIDADNKEEIIRLLADLLVKNGCIKPEYYDIVIKREEQYPTGLPTEGIQVAIPHGFSEGCVMKPSIGVATLTRPVIFRNMADQDEELSVGIVFLLALTKADAGELDKVMSIFSNGDLLRKLHSAKTARDVMDILGESLKEQG
jgi:PTS system galactitol-specific IIA component